MSIQCCYFRQSKVTNPVASFSDAGVIAVANEVNPLLELPLDFQTMVNMAVGCLKLNFDGVSPDPALLGDNRYEWVFGPPPLGYHPICKNSMTLEVTVAGDPDPVIVVLLESLEFRP